MSSDSETSILSDTSETPEEESRDSDDDWEGIASQYSPYQDEPLADDTDDETDYGGEEELDIDGLTPTVLAERYERTVTVDSWCRCEHCSVETLVGSLEYRCCREVAHTSGLMVFDGSIEHIKCITQHEDFDAMTNKAVLLQVAPLLKDKHGGSYRRRDGVSENE
ncbi:hypothetical protein QZH41_003290 [Actinostola sp. cb2023]|nr:hypothetical protein QZH41_003290 [Actinostola sp. cb2023]